jgi:hypothetical protein
MSVMPFKPSAKNDITPVIVAVCHFVCQRSIKFQACSIFIEVEIVEYPVVYVAYKHVILILFAKVRQVKELDGCDAYWNLPYEFWIAVIASAKVN